MANIQTRTTADNRVMHTARIRIKGYPNYSARNVRSFEDFPVTLL